MTALSQPNEAPSTLLEGWYQLFLWFHLFTKVSPFHGFWSQRDAPRKKHEMTNESTTGKFQDKVRQRIEKRHWYYKKRKKSTLHLKANRMGQGWYIGLLHGSSCQPNVLVENLKSRYDENSPSKMGNLLAKAMARILPWIPVWFYRGRHIPCWFQFWKYFEL